MNKKKVFIITIILIIVIVILIKNNFGDTDKYDLNYENIVSQATLENNVEEEKIEEDLIKVHIEGEINNPGLIELSSGDRILDAIKKAGGTTNLADLSKVNLAYILSDGEKIYIPSLNGEENIEYIQNSTSNSKININTANVEELQTLNGIGESIASSIILYREKNGKFSSIEEIKNVSGIGDSKFEKIKDDICVK